MIQRVDVRNYQSLVDVSLELDGFTVVVGRTSSGKSALTRAIRMLTANARGSAFITSGETVCTVSAVTDRGTTVLRRSVTGKNDAYVTIPADGQDQRTYTTLGGTTPEEVSEFLGIQPSSALTFTSQFDPPYLLRDTPASVAATLGELTGASVILDAAREARRQHLATRQMHKTRAADLASATSDLDDYASMKSQRQALKRATDALPIAGALRDRIERLESLKATLRATATALREAPEPVDFTATLERIATARALRERQRLLEATKARLKPLPSIPAPPPDLTQAKALQRRVARLGDLASTVERVSVDIKAADSAEALAVREADAAAAEYTDILKAAGECPTCHQSTKHLEHTHA